MTEVLPCLDLTCLLRFQMTTEPFVAADASMCSRNKIRKHKSTKENKDKKQEVPLWKKKYVTEKTARAV